MSIVECQIDNDDAATAETVSGIIFDVKVASGGWTNAVEEEQAGGR